jgi:hypothetical protein
VQGTRGFRSQLGARSGQAAPYYQGWNVCQFGRLFSVSLRHLYVASFSCRAGTALRRSSLALFLANWTSSSSCACNLLQDMSLSGEWPSARPAARAALLSGSTLLSKGMSNLELGRS